MPDHVLCDVELTVLVPCLNEAETLAACIDEARERIVSEMVSDGITIRITRRGSISASPLWSVDRGRG